MPALKLYEMSGRIFQNENKQNKNYRQLQRYHMKNKELEAIHEYIALVKFRRLQKENKINNQLECM